jgi:lipoic acid synthetase
MIKNEIYRLPSWMKMKFPKGEEYSRVKNIVTKNNLNTICTSGKCPNIGECWACGTATFMILGNICTRNCKFCGVSSGKPFPPDPKEPQILAETINKMGISHAVITSVDRDDLEDGGANFWAQTITSIKNLNHGITMEVLIPDFDGRSDCLEKIINTKPEVISHNLETVERLTPDIRTKAKYKTSLKVLNFISKSGIVAKSGIMLGLGETKEEVLKTMDDLLDVGVKVMTIGQYLAPSNNNFKVKEFFEPDVFEEYKILGLNKGFSMVESSPLVRSSYMAAKHINA